MRQLASHSRVALQLKHAEIAPATKLGRGGELLDLISVESSDAYRRCATEGRQGAFQQTTQKKETA